MSPDHGRDRLLDRMVIPGYSRLGLILRRRRWAPDDPRPSALVGRTALVTGAGSGLGEATALGLARLGARVHLLVRSTERAAPALERIRLALAADGIEPDLHIEECDLSDLSAVSDFGARWCAHGDGTRPIDVLVHNAGVMPSERTKSVDGHELSVATHVLGPIRLTESLLPALGRSTSGARVVFVASGGMYTQSLPASDPEYRRGRYRGAVAYARSKRMQVELVPLLARRWAEQQLTVAAMHPGWVDTPGIAASLPQFSSLTRPLLRSPAEGADTAVWLAATDPAPTSGRFWHDRTQRPTNYRTATRTDPADLERFRTWTASTTGIDL